MNVYHATNLIIQNYMKMYHKPNLIIQNDRNVNHTTNLIIQILLYNKFYYTKYTVIHIMDDNMF